jgi:hypothetical protein
MLRMQAVAPCGSFDFAPVEHRMFLRLDGSKSIRISASGEGKYSLQHKERSVPLFLNLSPKLILTTASAHPGPRHVLLVFQLRKK